MNKAYPSSTLATRLSAIVCLTAVAGGMYPLRQGEPFRNAAIAVVRSMPSDSICDGKCVAVIVDPRLRLARTVEERREPEQWLRLPPSGPPLSSDGSMRISLGEFATNHLGKDTIGYRVVFPDTSRRDTLRILVQIFGEGYQLGETHFTLIRTGETWSIVRRRTYVI